MLRAESQDPKTKTPKRQASKFLALHSLDHGDRVTGEAVAAPEGVEVRRAIVQVAGHAEHAQPRLVVELGGVQLVPAAEPGAPLLVVDGLDPFREEPAEDDADLGERVRTADVRDARPLAVGLEVDDRPLDARLVRVISGEEPEAVDVLLAVLVVAGQEQLPAPVLRVDMLEACGVRLKGLDHAGATLAPADVEDAVRVTTLGPLGSRRDEVGDLLLGDQPAFLLYGLAQRGDLRVERHLEGVLGRSLSRDSDLLVDAVVLGLADGAGHDGVASLSAADVPAPRNSVCQDLSLKAAA